MAEGAVSSVELLSSAADVPSVLTVAEDDEAVLSAGDCDEFAGEEKRSDCESYFHSGFPFGYFLFFLICLILITFITIPAVTNSDRTAINIRLFVLSGLSSCACTSLVTGV